MSGMKKETGGVEARALGKGATESAGTPMDEADPADVARFKNAMKGNAAGELRDPPAQRVQQAEAGEKPQGERRDDDVRMSSSSPAPADEQYGGAPDGSPHQVDRARSRAEQDDDNTDETDKTGDADDAPQGPEAAPDDLASLSEPVLGSETAGAGNASTADSSAQLEKAASMMQATAELRREFAAGQAGGSGLDTVGHEIEGVGRRYGGAGGALGIDEEAEREQSDKVVVAAAGDTRMLRPLADGPDAVDAPDGPSQELAELVDKLVDQIRVSIPDSPNQSVSLTLSQDLLQGADITIRRTDEGLVVSFQTPSPEIADQLNGKRDQLASRLGVRLNERVQVAVAGPSAALRGARPVGGRDRRQVELEDDDDR